MNTRKQQIVELASDLLRTKGYEGFSYKDLSEQLGIRKASIHHHFPKKEDLGIALCNWTRAWLNQGLEHFDAKASNQWDKLVRYVRASKRHVIEDHRNCPLQAFHGDANRLPNTIREEMKRLDDIELNWVVKVLTEGQKSGEFNSSDNAKALAAMFIFSVKGALHYSDLHNENLIDDALEQFKKLLIAR